jgi:hypothetical protein
VTTREYSGAVAKLLTIGVPTSTYDAAKWPNLPQEYGLTEADISELIRLATDKDLFYAETEEEYPEDYQWGAINAIQALGQLKAAQAVAPFMEILKWEDDYTLETLPPAFGLIGQPAIAPLARALREWYSKKYDSTAATTVDALEKIATNYPETRDEVIEVLLDRLNTPEKNDDSLNGFLIASLTDLKAEKALPAIERAFKQDLVATMILRWHSVQYEFGLISKEEHDKTEEEFRAAQRAMFNAEREPATATDNDYDPFRGSNLNPSGKKQKEKAKAKRKMAKASQKKNRKRK